MSSTLRGAYGFRLNCPQTDPLPHLIPLDPAAPLVTVSWRLASTTRDVEEVADDRVAYGFRGGATYYVEREPLALRFDIPYVPSPSAVVHPLLTIGMSVLGRWRGDVTLHGGAFEAHGKGWAVMGTRSAGKSSILASFGQRGYPVLSDDLILVRDGAIWSGPGCVDLRPDVAERFPDAVPLGVIGGRPRHRLETPPARPRVPLRGLFLLDWHEDDEVRIEPLSAQDRLRWLYRQEYIPLVGYSDPSGILPLLALPAWRLVRPRDWAATDAMIERVLEVTERESRTPGGAVPTDDA